MGIWDVFWTIIWAFFFFAYLFVLVLIVIDVFRDHKLNGWWKAVWLLFLIFVPFLTALVYVIARGRGMAERSRGSRPTTSPATGTSATTEIERANALLQSGAITQDEFNALKSRALGTQYFGTY
ncbi:SHOCT domain-containing protein [Microbacterium sp. X-17]|uniref:SHOCT domain-containing protein n=1 Tax=Microbacterium sp. X-17 TaxID=3144404 RepID=UPI0031F5B208